MLLPLAPVGRFARSGAFALAVGVVASVAPFELASGVVVWALAFGLYRAVKHSGWALFVTQLLLGWWVVSLAADAHTKGIDRPVPRQLTAQAMTVSELRRQLGPRMQLDPAAAEDTRRVVLPSLHPTWRDVDDALAPLGLELRGRSCGTGATVLWGASPMGLWEFAPRKPLPPPSPAPPFRLG